MISEWELKMYHVYSAGLGETKAYIFKHTHPHRKKHNELHTHKGRERDSKDKCVTDKIP